MDRMELKEEEIKKNLKPLKNKWRICTILEFVTGLLLCLGLVLIFFTSRLWIKDFVEILLDISSTAVTVIGFIFIASIFILLTLITHVEGGRRRMHTVVDVDGRILEISFPKQIEETVKIVKKKDPYTLSESDKIEMEDVDFNQKFDVFAKDKHSAFYLLTPQFMEYIKKLYNRDDRVYISFDGEKVYFLQSGHGGIFEPPKEKIDIFTATIV